MTRFPSLLCPTDFSDASRAALGHAAAIADHFGAELTVLTVSDPLVAALAASEPTHASFELETDQALQRYTSEVLGNRPPGPGTLRLRQAVGTPATEIVREAVESHADLIVMSSHGRRGLQKMFFGSTTERVLRETPVPVLIAPAARTEPLALSELAGRFQEVIAPVDLSSATPHQLTIASAIANALSVPLMLMHVLKPVFAPFAGRWSPPTTDDARLDHAQQQLKELQASIPPHVRTESLVLTGEPSEEIVKTADSRRTSLIVMGLHSSGMLGPRMGSVTYRVLCLSDSFVLALPPHAPPVTAGVAVRRRTSA
jgi:nucleotide-binding universal stress UspA family protein